ncbi:YybH family protein [Xylophilus sp. GOD-11R]|uniref:YybH family protein n=1 Tax=Xylophilus sp. GOD-11R TaxID=3089814 RepID=UPI00298C683F|nr:nuclear transport factor 2 family protein [Xylophilus sp. GOD-11R]WPB58419.1 nuclear transport factor 2 family protein [Xylophilus sp. GOD-11R]
MPDSDVQTILALLREQEAAIARGDAAAVHAAIADDAVVYDLPPPLEYRGAAARDDRGLNAWFATWENGVTVQMADPVVMVDGDLAVVHGLSRMRGTKKDSGPVDIWNRRTVVLRREPVGWRVVHEHGSYPMRMDGSGRAALDLKP